MDAVAVAFVPSRRDDVVLAARAVLSPTLEPLQVFLLVTGVLAVAAMLLVALPSTVFVTVVPPSSRSPPG